MPETIREAGFVDIQEKSYKWPIGPWPRDQKYKEAGTVHVATHQIRLSRAMDQRTSSRLCCEDACRAEEVPLSRLSKSPTRVGT